MSEPMVVYANAVQMEIGPFDLVLHFGIKKDRSQPGWSPEDAQVSVYMSPEHAKVLHQILAQGIAQFEARNGTIPVSANVATRIEEAGR